MKDDEQKAVRVDSWGFETGMSGQGRGAPMLGVILIVFGVLLAAGQLLTVAHLGASFLFLALGVALLLRWVRDRGDAALYLGILVTALALSAVLTDTRVISGGGWGWLFLGVGILALVPARLHAGKGWGWPLAIGGILAMWGGFQVLTNYLNLDTERLIGPALLVLLGLWLMRRNRG